jgi:hypothetical protein
LQANEPAPQLMPAWLQCMKQPPPAHFIEHTEVSSHVTSQPEVQVTMQFEPDLQSYMQPDPQV